MTYNIEFKITDLDELQYNQIIELLKNIKGAEVLKETTISDYKESWNPDWKGDPHDPLRWKGW